MDHKCRFGSVVNLSTSSARGWGDSMPKLLLGHIYFVPANTFSIFTLLCFPCSLVSYSFLAVPLCKCCGQYLCMSSSLSIAILNVPSFFVRKIGPVGLEALPTKSYNNNLFIISDHRC